MITKEVLACHVGCTDNNESANHHYFFRVHAGDQQEYKGWGLRPERYCQRGTWIPEARLADPVHLICQTEHFSHSLCLQTATTLSTFLVANNDRRRPTAQATISVVWFSLQVRTSVIFYLFWSYWTRSKNNFSAWEKKNRIWLCKSQTFTHT